MTVRDRLVSARDDAVAIGSAVVPAIDTAIAEYDAAYPGNVQTVAPGEFE